MTETPGRQAIRAWAKGVDMKKHVSEPQEEKDNERDLSQGFLGVREVACYLGVRPSTIYAMVERKGIPHYKVGRLVRFKKFEIDEWMAGQKEPVVDAMVEARKVIRSLQRKPNLDLDRIMKKVVEQSKKRGYNFPQEKPGGIEGLGKEVDDGII
jgi:excisionase family DNA binding protein